MKNRALSERPSTGPAIGLISLGCSKNLADAENLCSVLLAMGYRIEPEYERCDLIIVNTCGFIEAAVEESRDAIAEALEHSDKVIVTGCLGARAQKIRELYPQVLAVYGPGMRATVLRGIIRILGRPPLQARQQVEPSGILLTPSHYAFIKIAEGCRHHCTFCIIPSLRGPLRSRNPEAILSQARDLRRRGVKELLIIAQDSSDYGIDLNPQTSLSALLGKLAAYKGWIRLHYVYPGKEADRVVALMGEGLILPYLDVPLQHASPEILKAMKRPGNIDRIYHTLEHWRALCPNLAIRSTFITGFPGETRSRFEELLSFLREAKLDRVGCFPYSNIEGAAARELPGQVDEEEKQARVRELMEVQEQISFTKLEARMGSTCQVLIDYTGEDGTAVGRSKYESPDVDGVITLSHAKGLRPGDFVSAVIVGHDAHDLKAVPASTQPEQATPAPVKFKKC